MPQGIRRIYLSYQLGPSQASDLAQIGSRTVVVLNGLGNEASMCKFCSLLFSCWDMLQKRILRLRLRPYIYKSVCTVFYRNDGIIFRNPPLYSYY